MKVLIISQPVLSKTNNMGKTLMGYFRDFSPDDISQLYLHEGVPENTDVCEKYYCFSDSDAMKSILNHKIQGKSFTKESEVFKKKDAEEVAEKDEIYKLGAAHKAWMLFVRDTIWKLSSWKNRELLKWLDRTGADVIFFAPGDGAFIYRIADEIARYLNKPLIMVCMDDFFINNRNKKEILGGIRQKNFMRVVNKTAKDCDMIFTICDEMNDAYGKLFEKKCLTLHTVAERKNVQLAQTARHVSYIGNLKCGRYKTLIDIGKALSELRDENVPNVIDVYSGTREFDCIEPLKKAPGINFCGEISAESVLEVMANSMAVIHTESFEQEMMELVRFSVSTKIAESLMYGPCLITYGPEGIASIDYLKENNAAYVISRPEDLEKGLEEILTNKELREQIVRNARALALKNHNADVNPRKVRKWLQEVVDKSQNENSTN